MPVLRTPLNISVKNGPDLCRLIQLFLVYFTLKAELVRPCYKLWLRD